MKCGRAAATTAAAAAAAAGAVEAADADAETVEAADADATWLLGCTATGGGLVCQSVTSSSESCCLRSKMVLHWALLMQLLRQLLLLLRQP